jgi:hypothetical protein
MINKYNHTFDFQDAMLEAELSVWRLEIVKRIVNPKDYVPETQSFEFILWSLWKVA